jgi:hypothetical protein
MQIFKLNVLDYFRIIIIIIIIIINTPFALNYDQNSGILVACDNTYTMESKDEMYLLIFFSI